MNFFYRVSWEAISSKDFLAVLLSGSFLLTSCSSDDSKSKNAGQDVDFPDSVLREYMSWNPVLAGDLAFASTGHSGQLTRVYFNETAAPHFSNDKTLPFSEGAYVAKAVVATSDTPSSNAMRVYFMLKKAAGFDIENGDWSYGVSNLKNGKLEFDSEYGRLSGCIGCHSAEKQWDYVRTVEYFRTQIAE